MQGTRAATEVIDALAAPRPRPGGRRDRGRPRRRLGRGPAALQRRGPGPRGGRHPHAGRLRDRARARHPAARPRRRRPRLDADRRRQAPRARRRRGGQAASRGPATGSAPWSPAASSASSRAWPTCARAPRWPTRAACSTPRAVEVDRPARPRHAGCSTTGSTAPLDDDHPPARTGPGALPARDAPTRVRRGAAAPTVPCSPSVADAALGRPLTIRVADGRVLATTDRRRARPRLTEEDQMAEQRPSRATRRPASELVDVVRASRPAAPPSRRAWRCGSAARSSRPLPGVARRRPGPARRGDRRRRGLTTRLTPGASASRSVSGPTCSSSAGRREPKTSSASVPTAATNAVVAAGVGPGLPLPASHAAAQSHGDPARVGSTYVVGRACDRDRRLHEPGVLPS